MFPEKELRQSIILSINIVNLQQSQGQQFSFFHFITNLWPKIYDIIFFLGHYIFCISKTSHFSPLNKINRAREEFIWKTETNC